MFLLNNPLMFRNRTDRGKLSLNFFQQQAEINVQTLSKLRFCDIARPDGSIRTPGDISQCLGVDISPALFLRLATAARHWLDKNRQAQNGEGVASLESFLRTFKKGSNKFRKIICSKTEKPLLERAHVKSFYRITGIPADDDHAKEKNFGGWNVNQFTNQMRDFIFKFTNNCLPLNTRLSHYVPGKTRGCTFCEIATYRPGPDESFTHLFANCPNIQEWQRNFARAYIGTEPHQNFWFVIPDQNECNEYLQMLRWTFLFTIWEFKLKHRKVSWVSFKIELDQKINRILKVSPTLRIRRDVYNYQHRRNFPPHE